MNESENIMSARNDRTGKEPIRIYNIYEAGEIDFVDVGYMGERKNLELQYQVYTEEDNPYNQIPETTPYIVIKNNVYELDSFNTVGFRSIEIE